jgi:hypothetical protein
MVNKNHENIYVIVINLIILLINFLFINNHHNPGNLCKILIL